MGMACFLVSFCYLIVQDFLRMFMLHDSGPMVGALARIDIVNGSH